ncbi:mandelate racemase/muconate lactonizing enzyme family protein [Microvirga lotononidis]|uniref:Enolase superfamily enzyme related to L-alanine-DL-glutamate epimerase n=1 Tax=Microvirga lotononidis TaxID=864069 RepID=I4YR08_9HYPH|nr:mandelate racemase/muconate lactonizing enzyme family protein [Microvirga lotononidis]EIM26400.1 enolase superfamily enzyme related to L-alanine-DL-glutamate epimerase [Microvirga lotononidis]WQO30763.1 mandelate racemase/muconate lactonizing enzyme family protein [Microvirga lotononidis]
MRITNVELRQIKADLPSTFSGGTYTLAARTALLCRITTDQGLGSVVCVGNESGYSSYLKSLVRGAFKDLLVGADPLRGEWLWQRMLDHDKAYIDRASLMMAVATVDAALWDLKGQITGLPVWRLLGGVSAKVPVIGIGGYYETSRDEDGIRREIRSYREQGLAGIKFKVGALSIEEDAERVRIARDEAGPRFAIVADSNMAWTPDEAVRFARLIEPHDIAWLEEPTRPRNFVRALREVRWKTGMRIGAGQSEVSVFDAYHLIQSEAVDVINVTYNRGGGITGWVKLAGAASFSDIRMGQVGEPHISMHMMAGISNPTYVECYPDPHRDPLWAELYIDRPEPKNGFITVPDRPGLGLILNPEAVERLAIEPWS